MNLTNRPASLLAEKAVRYLRDRQGPVASRRLVQDLLSTSSGSETDATLLLEKVFDNDPRLLYEDSGWVHTGEKTDQAAVTASGDPPRVLGLLHGERNNETGRWELHQVLMVRLVNNETVSACGGDLVQGVEAEHLRRSILETLDEAVLIVHDPPAALKQLEAWLGAPVGSPVSLRVLARDRLGMPSSHSLEDLAARLKLQWRETGDPLDMAEVLDQALNALRRDGESLDALQEASSSDSSVIHWHRLNFDREFLRSLPKGPGIYRFLDRNANLLYIGKSRNLHSRVGSYFNQSSGRSERVQKIISDLYDIQIEPAGSDLEAMLQEAARIRKEHPARNRQREIHPRAGLASRLRSILIIEPATAPAVLNVYLIRDGRLLRKLPVGPRGGGIKRIERTLEDHFFIAPDGPTPVSGPDVDVEVVARWLAANRERAVAFDPTDFPTPGEVTDRLRWFLSNGSPYDSDGNPIFAR
jgi:hypothetical protein